MAKFWITTLCMAMLCTVARTQVACPAGLFVSYTETKGMRLYPSTSEEVVYKYATDDRVVCFTYCKDLTTCEAFNYNAAEAQCEVLQSDDDSKLQQESNWNYYHISCSTTEPSSTSPNSEPEPEGEPEISAADVLEFIQDHPEYVAMIGMGLVILLLFITAIVILCCYTGGSASRSDKYREKP